MLRLSFFNIKYIKIFSQTSFKKEKKDLWGKLNPKNQDIV